MTLSKRLQHIQSKLQPNRDIALTIFEYAPGEFIEVQSDIRLTPLQVDRLRQHNRNRLFPGLTFMVLDSRDFRNIVGIDYTTKPGSLEDIILRGDVDA